MSYGNFSSAKSAINDFIHQGVVDGSLDTRAPRTINVSQRFASFLADNGFQRYRAEEEAEKQRTLLTRRLDEVLDEWKALGVRMPLGFSEDQNVLLTWRHPKSADITGEDLLSSKYIEIFNWLPQLDARQYLLVGALFLKMLRCDPIFVTDGPNDGGVDCIGRVCGSPLRSLIVFVQVKTRQKDRSPIGKNLVLQEFEKYKNLSEIRKYHDYLNALGFERMRDGCASVFVMMSNVEFTFESQILGRNLGMLLRSKRQIAHFLSDHIVGVDRLVDTGTDNEIPVPARSDLNTNFAPLLDPFVIDNRPGP